MTRLFGRMPKPSTATRGVEQWIASLRAARANPSVSPDSGKGQKTHGIFGLLSPELSESAGRRSSSSRTSQTTLFSDLKTSEQSYRDLVTGLKLDYLARQKSGRRISESDCSPWPTPSACIANDGEQPATWLARADTLKAKHGNGNGAGTPLTIASLMWPTPMVPSGGRSSSAEEVAAKGAPENGKRQIGLESATKLWPSPTASMTTGAGEHGTGGPNLQTTVSNWSTPRVTTNGGNGKNRGDNKSRLEDQVHTCPPSHPDPVTESSGNESSASTRRLNPQFVEWLMGVPIGWTSCEPLATESYRSWLATHSRLFTELFSRDSAA